ncbi:MAG: surface lipoprotein assembly modifier [Acinetobacter populi]|uniref:surface lipoprotein assembly modifier n=1 Tax=Acinetobacter populi TaxID=1582270 RepID=UPI0023558AEA|nr:surface lipoprotein assembly modifier [Acinetobacter populi]MCH4248298.1 surface lipoprotein assembly modifier [Acinetobacter populi]
MKQTRLITSQTKNKLGYHAVSLLVSPLFIFGLLSTFSSTPVYAEMPIPTMNMAPSMDRAPDLPEPAAVAIQPLDNLDKLSPDLSNSDRYRAPDEQHKKALEDHKQQKQQKPVNVTDEDVKNNPQIAEIIISTSIQKRDWKTLEKVLPLYLQSVKHDPMLVLYAQGALFRHQGKHKQAIQQYQKMLENDATLDYVRFDLGAMLFENRQYREAEKIFIQTRDNSEVEQNFRILSEKFLQQIQKQEKVSGKARLRFVQNDNVNQSTADRYLTIGDWILTKKDENMPQSSIGTNYMLDFEQNYNLTGNHSINWNASINGLNYASAHDFDEHGINLGLNYKWQDTKSWFYIGPSLSWNWLGRERYVDSYGWSSNYGRWLSPRWQATIMGGWRDKTYKNSMYSAFNGNTILLSPSIVYLFSADSAIFGGLIWQREDVKTQSESFNLYGANLGMSKQWKNGFNATANTQLAWRKYLTNHPTFTALERKDRRLNAMINVGHKKLNFWQVEPKLGFQYDDVDSNIDVFYTRTIRQWMLTFERKF